MNPALTAPPAYHPMAANRTTRPGHDSPPGAEVPEGAVSAETTLLSPAGQLALRSGQDRSRLPEWAAIQVDAGAEIWGGWSQLVGDEEFHFDVEGGAHVGAEISLDTHFEGDGVVVDSSATLDAHGGAWLDVSRDVVIREDEFHVGTEVGAEIGAELEVERRLALETENGSRLDLGVKQSWGPSLGARRGGEFGRNVREGTTELGLNLGVGPFGVELHIEIADQDVEQAGAAVGGGLGRLVGTLSGDEGVADQLEQLGGEAGRAVAEVPLAALDAAVAGMHAGWSALRPEGAGPA